MPREIRITDDRQRDARVAMESPKRPPGRRIVAPGGRSATFSTFVKVPEGKDYRALLKAHGDDAALARALVEGDPEIDLEAVGRRVGPVDRVWVKQDGSVLYTGRVLLVVTSPDGAEVERKDFIDVEKTVDEDQALPFSGRLFPVDEVVRRFALTRRLQLRHSDGLTWEFLHALAAKLQETKKMLLVGAGPRAARPLIFQRNGSPYRGFLSGRVDGEAYLLALHLSNLELKRAAAPATSAPAASSAMPATKVEP